MRFADFSLLVHARRTSMGHDRSREVDAATIDQLCELALWAPNHKQTWPWRFAAFTGEARARLGQAYAQDLAAQAAAVGADPDERRLAKTGRKYLRAPAILVVASAPDDDPILHAENRDAVAAGVQNLLLGATAMGLNSYWSSPPVSAGGQANALCGFGPLDEVIAVIYLGWAEPDRPGPQPPERPALRIMHLS